MTSQGQGGAKQVNRAEIVDRNFRTFVSGLDAGKPGDPARTLPGSRLTGEALLELLDSQLKSRQLDLMARVKRLENKVFYTIGSAGHEGNALVGRLTRHTDPAFLHYRSGGFMAERSRQLPDIDFIQDTALSFAAAARDPASGGRHKVWGSKPLWVLPQTSTIASHLPKAVGAALAIAHAGRIGHSLPIPDDSIAICSFGDASANHATAQSAFNTAAWTAHQGLPLPVLFVCEDNNLGISVKTPRGWIEENFGARHGLDYRQADGLDLASGYDAVADAVEHCRRRRRPVFLHLKTCRLMGHAGTDFEVDYRSQDELEACERSDPLLRSAELAVGHGLISPEALLERYEALRSETLQAADEADEQEKLTTLEQVIAPLAPHSAGAVAAEARRDDYQSARLEIFGSEAALPENQPARHLAVQINRGLKDLMASYPSSLLFGEDVAQKGGVYTVTRQLQKLFGRARVFNTLLDETTILGLAQGFGTMGMLPIPEIQYLAYLHNAADQIRGEAASLQYFSNDQYRNPMLVRIAALGYQKGFGGHFHNDNSIAAIRDIPGLVVACPSRGDDAVGMLRTLAAMARVDGRVCAFLEPIALYMSKDLFEEGDNGWCFGYPPPGTAVDYGEARFYGDEACEVLLITYGNGVPMSLRAARSVTGSSIRVMDLRWLQPLNAQAIVQAAETADAVLVVDEGRSSAGLGEGVMTALVENGHGGKPIQRVCGADCFTPLGDAAGLVLPDEAAITEAIRNLVDG